MTQQDIFEPDGRAISYVDEGEGPALILLPARDHDIGYLGTLASVLAEEGFRVLRVGSRGAGDAAASIRENAQDVVDVMHEVGLADAWIGGHASGGLVARATAESHTELVNGILLLGVEEAPNGEELASGVPVLVIQGSDDQTTPPANGESLRTAAPDRVSVTTIDGGGHLFAATHPGETAAIIEDYLDWD